MDEETRHWVVGIAGAHTIALGKLIEHLETKGHLDRREFAKILQDTTSDARSSGVHHKSPHLVNLLDDLAKLLNKPGPVAAGWTPAVAPGGGDEVKDQG
jgi:hypothetical protein